MAEDSGKIALTEMRQLLEQLRRDAVRQQETIEVLWNLLNNQTEITREPPPPAFWMPAAAAQDKKAPASEALLVTRVAANADQPVQTVSRLRASWPGQFYIRHLKRFGTMQRFTQWAWRNGYPLFANFTANYSLKRGVRTWRPLLPLAQACATSAFPVTRYVATERVTTPLPFVSPETFNSEVADLGSYYMFPDLYVAEIANATICGGTNMVISGTEVLCHDLFDCDRDYTSEELHARAVIDHQKKRVRLLTLDAFPTKLDRAANFIDACAPNYAHWITEVLPRLAVFCADPANDGIPIVVNEGLHRNIMASVLCVAGASRQVIALPVGKDLNVARLSCVSVAGYVPFERRLKHLKGHSHGLFSASAFKMLQDAIRANIEPSAERDWPSKLYLRRTSGIRKVSNSKAVEEHLVAEGFVIVEPERLSFSEQVHLFRNASVIVGSSGAALANLVFCRPGTKIVVMIGMFPNTAYGYWQNMACASGNVVHYVFGSVDGAHGAGIHADFSVDVTILDSALQAESQS